MSNKKIYPWVVVGLLWGVALLNYMDRQMLSTMKDAMMIDITELESAANFGRLMAVFLWIYGFMSPVAGMIADRVNPQMVDRRQPVRLVVRHADDGLLHDFQPDLFPARPHGGKRSLVYPGRIVADNRLPPGENPFAGSRHPHDRSLHRTGFRRFRCDSGKRLYLGNDFPLVRDCRYCILCDSYSVPER